MVHDLEYASKDSAHFARIKAIAKHQNHLTGLFIALLIGHFLAFGIPVLSVLLLAAAVYLCVVLVRLMRAMCVTPTWMVLAIVGLFVPLVQLMVLVIVNYKACEILRLAGLKVGLVGVSDEEMARFEQEQF